MANLKKTTINNSGSFIPPLGDTVLRSIPAKEGDIRFNSSISAIEFFNNSYWRTLPVPTIINSGLLVNLDVGTFKDNPGYFNASTWTTGSGDEVGFTKNGNTTENFRIQSTDPFGNPAVIWEARPESTSGADGGWNGEFFATDPYKLYRYSTWVRRTVTGNGRFYLGCKGSPAPVLRRDTAETNTNPYFWSGGLSGSSWQLVVGHVWPANSGTGSDHPDSGRYNTAGSKFATISRDYISQPTTTSNRLRSYLYYSTNTSTRQRWWQPRVDVCDGSEPSIQELISNSPNTWIDYSPKGNHATLINIPLTTDNGMTVNGNNKTVNINNLDLTDVPALSSWTMGIWVQFTSVPPLNHQGVVIGAAYYSGAGIYWSSNGSTISISSFIRGEDSSRSSPDIEISLNTPYYLAVTNEQPSSKLNLYMNGELINTIDSASQEYNSNNASTAGPLGIAKPQIRSGGGGSYVPFTGEFYAAHIYSRALTNTEIQKNFLTKKEELGL